MTIDVSKLTELEGVSFHLDPEDLSKVNAAIISDLTEEQVEKVKEKLKAVVEDAEQRLEMAEKARKGAASAIKIALSVLSVL
jgi:UDP-N-acetylglucosamine:LPS N-acetylglucosamine transferase